jgi:hypothetical protein
MNKRDAITDDFPETISKAATISRDAIYADCRHYRPTCHPGKNCFSRASYAIFRLCDAQHIRMEPAGTLSALDGDIAPGS